MSNIWDEIDSAMLREELARMKREIEKLRREVRQRPLPPVRDIYPRSPWLPRPDHRDHWSPRWRFDDARRASL